MIDHGLEGPGPLILRLGGVWGNGPAPRRAFVRHFVGEVLGVGQQAVLQRVDAGVDRLDVADRAEVAGDLDAPPVRGGGDGPEIFPADFGVHLEPRGALVGPVVDHPGRLGRCGDMAALEDIVWSSEIRPAQDHPGTGHLAGLDLGLERDVGIRREAAGGPSSGHPGRQVQSGCAEAELPPAARAGVEEMVVEADQARNDGETRSLEDLGAGGNRDRLGGPDDPDPAARDHDGLPQPSGRPGSVDHRHADERHHRIGHHDRRIPLLNEQRDCCHERDHESPGRVKIVQYSGRSGDLAKHASGRHHRQRVLRITLYAFHR